MYLRSVSQARQSLSCCSHVIDTAYATVAHM